MLACAPFFAFAFGEDTAHRVAEGQALELLVRHAVGVAVDVAEFLGLEESMVVEQAHDAASWRGRVALHAATLATYDVLEAAGCGFEHVADRDVDVLVGVMEITQAVRDHVRSGNADVDPNVVEGTLALMMVRRFDDNVATDDPIVEPLDPLGVLAHRGLEGGGGVHASERDLKG